VLVLLISCTGPGGTRGEVSSRSSTVPLFCTDVALICTDALVVFNQ